MRLGTRSYLNAMCGSILFFATDGGMALGNDKLPRKTLHARAIISGPGGIEGIVRFEQHACEGCPTPGLSAPADDDGFKNFPAPTVDIIAEIRAPSDALTPGAHGMHIHEVGQCGGGSVIPFGSAGGHFDPGPFSNSGVDINHPFHMGDLPNLIVNQEGVGLLKTTTSRITLSPGPLSIFDANGSSIVIKLNPDRGINGVAGSGVSGGPRIACGVIEMVDEP